VILNVPYDLLSLYGFTEGLKVLVSIQRPAMGSSPSKPLIEWSTDDLKEAMSPLGLKYQPYCTAIAENSIDGSVLASLTEQELEEALEDLGITNRLHRLVLRKKMMTVARQGKEDGLVTEVLASSNAKEAPKHVIGIPVKADQKEEVVVKEEDEKEIKADEIPKDLPLLTEEDLAIFDDIVAAILEKTHYDSIFYVGIHLIVEQGQMVLSGALRAPRGEEEDGFQRWLIRPHGVSLCSTLVRHKVQDSFMKVKLPRMGMTYRGHVLRNSSGNRIGTLCLIERLSQNIPQNSKEDYVSLMKEIATLLEDQMRAREDLIQRTARLMASMQLLEDGSQPELTTVFQNAAEIIEKENIEPEQVAQPKGIADNIGQEGAISEMSQAFQDSEASSTLQGMCMEDALSNDAVESDCSEPELVTRKLKSLSSDCSRPEVHKPTEEDATTAACVGPQSLDDTLHLTSDLFGLRDNLFLQGRASMDDSLHLSSDFFRLHDKHEIPRPPIAKDDMQSIATVAALDLHRMHPDSMAGKNLLRITNMAARTSDCPVCFVNFHDHSNQYRIGNPVAMESEVNIMLENSGVGILRRRANGNPFSYVCLRAPVICNYTLFLKRPFVVPDVAKDARFKYIADMAGVHFYAAIPLITGDNLVLGTLCLMDLKPRPDFEPSTLEQLAYYAFAAQQEIMDWYVADKEKRHNESLTRLVSIPDKSQVPSGEVSIVQTSVEGSSELWEQDPGAMQTALDLHDDIVRERLRTHRGYEISYFEEGEFCLAFHDPVDAVRFALDCQLLLHDAPWPQALLDLPEAATQETECFRGLRVRMSIVHGRVKCNKDEATLKILYSGVAYNLAKSLDEICRGGQILSIQETWDLATCSRGKSLGEIEVMDIGKQVVDLGRHVLCGGLDWCDRVVAKAVVQIVPRPLSYNYFKARRLAMMEQFRTPILGRTFPPLITMRQLGPSFHDAPQENNQVTIMVLSTKSLAQKCSDKQLQIVKLRLGCLVRELVNGFGRGVYYCHDLTIAFDGPTNAIGFGFLLVVKLREWRAKGDPLRLLRRINIGCFQGEFSSMGPHERTGRAVYVGSVVDRAALVANAAAPGTICFGTIVSPGSPIWVLEFKPPSLGDDWEDSNAVQILGNAQSESAPFGRSLTR
jgi:class 3 adenylate cyclase